MLAATFARRLLAGENLSDGCKPFADYAAALRQGLRPTDLAPEDSLEGVFLAIRSAAANSTSRT